MNHHVSRTGALALLTGGAFALARPAAAQTPLVNVRIGALTIDAFGEAYWGAENGIFQANGINPQITSLTNGAAIMAAVLGGDLDVGMSNTVVTANAVARGIPVQVLAPASMYSLRDNASDLMVAKDSPFKTAKDLIGGTVAVSALKDLSQLGVMAWLERNGVSREGVHFVELKFGEMGAAIQRGIVQAAIISEPAKSAALREGQIRPFADVYLAIAPEWATIVWFTTKPWLQKNPDTAKRLVNAIFATARWANTHTQESAVILAKVAKMDLSVINGMRRLYFGTSNDPKFFEAPLDLAARYGILQRPVTVAEFLAAT